MQIHANRLMTLTGRIVHLVGESISNAAIKCYYLFFQQKLQQKLHNFDICDFFLCKLLMRTKLGKQKQTLRTQTK